MGIPKRSLTHCSTGETLLHWQWRRLAPQFRRSFLLSGSEEIEEFDLGSQICDPPEYKGQGPLAALLSGLECLPKESWLAVLALDYPYFPVEAFREAEGSLEGCSGLVFCEEPPQRHWLCAFYHASLTRPLREALEGGERAVKRFMGQHEIRYEPLRQSHHNRAFQNLNYPEDLEQTDFQLSFRPLQ